MLLKKLKDFHERTMEQYKEEENLEPWKKKVMELHEKSAFLFYYDATLEENAEQNSLIIQGSDRKSTRLNSSHNVISRMPSSA